MRSGVCGLVETLIGQQFLDPSIEQRDFGSQILAFLPLDIELYLFGCLLQGKLRKIRAHRRKVYLVVFVLLSESGQPFLRNLLFGHSVAPLSLEIGDLAGGLTVLVRGNFQS